MGLTRFFWNFGNVLPSNCDFLPKTKMVRMVHRNLFYEMGLEISDEKKELWTKTENLEGSEISKSALRSKIGLLSFVLRPKSLLNILRYHPPPSRLNFQLNLYIFQ